MPQDTGVSVNLTSSTTPTKPSSLQPDMRARFHAEKAEAYLAHVNSASGTLTHELARAQVHATLAQAWATVALVSK